MLIGNYGIKRYEVNASGKRISQIDYIKERQGNKVNLTIDIEIQKYAQELLKGKAGSICAMDIYDRDQRERTDEPLILQCSPFCFILSGLIKSSNRSSSEVAWPS